MQTQRDTSAEPPILLTGATGMLGSRVLDQLLGLGRRVVAVSRSPIAAAAKRDSRVEWWELDLADDGAARPPSVQSVAAVIHAAGDMRASEEENFRINQLGTYRMLAVARRLRAARFVYVSSVAVYGDSEQIETGEGAPRAATGSYGRSKLAAEDDVFESDGVEGMTTCVVRPCPILGRGAGHLAHGLRTLVSQPTVPRPDCAKRRLDVVDVDDLAALVVDLALRHAMARGAFNASAGSALTLAEILSSAASAIGCSPHWQDASIAEAMAANDAAAARGDGPPVPPALIAFASVERTYSNQRARRELGFAPRDPRSALNRWVLEA